MYKCVVRGLNEGRKKTIFFNALPALTRTKMGTIDA